MSLSNLSKAQCGCQMFWSSFPFKICLPLQTKVLQTKVAQNKVVQTKVVQNKVVQTKVVHRPDL